MSPAASAHLLERPKPDVLVDDRDARSPWPVRLVTASCCTPRPSITSSPSGRYGSRRKKPPMIASSTPFATHQTSSRSVSGKWTTRTRVDARGWRTAYTVVSTPSDSVRRASRYSMPSIRGRRSLDEPRSRLVRLDRRAAAGRARPRPRRRGPRALPLRRGRPGVGRVSGARSSRARALRHLRRQRARRRLRSGRRRGRSSR